MKKSILNQDLILRHIRTIILIVSTLNLMIIKKREYLLRCSRTNFENKAVNKNNEIQSKNIENYIKHIV